VNPEVSAAPRSGLAARPSSGARLPGIEGLRAIAASSILVLHVWTLAPGENGTLLGPLERFRPDLAFGVILFFTLSGFLLYRPFAAAIIRDASAPSIRRYFRNRALRILPAYWVILLLCAALGSLRYWDSSDRLVNGRLLDPAKLAGTAAFVQDYSPSTVSTGIGPAWSLAVEVVFYCSLPLLVLMAARLARGRGSRAGRRWAVLAPAVSILVVGLSGKAAAAFLVPPSSAYDGWQQNWHSVLERSFWCQADLFAFGMALAVVRTDWEDGLLRLPRAWRSSAFTLAAGIYILVTTTSRGQRLGHSPANTLIALACALVLALVVLTDSASPSRFVRILETRLFVAAGVVSYSIFLWHEPLILWLKHHGLTVAGPGGFVIDLAVVVVVTGIASMITYRFVEAPALRLRFRAGRAESTPVPAAQIEAAP
jgi:peptidoglycan/LPS O-acetylase OafA/YrhL